MFSSVCKCRRPSILTYIIACALPCLVIVGIAAVETVLCSIIAFQSSLSLYFNPWGWYTVNMFTQCIHTCRWGRYCSHLHSPGWQTLRVAWCLLWWFVSLEKRWHCMPVLKPGVIKPHKPSLTLFLYWPPELPENYCSRYVSSLLPRLSITQPI